MDNGIVTICGNVKHQSYIRIEESKTLLGTSLFSLLSTNVIKNVCLYQCFTNNILKRVSKLTMQILVGVHPHMDAYKRG